MTFTMIKIIGLIKENEDFQSTPIGKKICYCQKSTL
jgi:hypothetical protein